MAQLLLFERNNEEKLMDEVKLLRESIDRIRKGQYAKLGALKKEIDDLKAEYKILLTSICRGEYAKST
jgi:hypothetical protein